MTTPTQPVPEVEAHPLLATDLVAGAAAGGEATTIFSAEAIPILHGSTSTKKEGGGSNDKKNTPGGSYFNTPYQTELTGGGGNTSEYWGRFNDPEVTVLPTTNTNPNDTPYDDLPVATARLDDRKIRHAFLRKVYMILTVQVLTTCGVCGYLSLNESARSFALGGAGNAFFYFNMFSMFILIFPLQFYKRTYPMNLILLGLFTLTASYTIGTVTAIYAEAGAGELVVEAAVITAIVFISLTIYTLQSKYDFSFMGAGLGCCLLIMIMWGLFSMIFGIQTGWVYGLFGTILFSLFVIYDTYMIAERTHPEDYVMAAVELYLDLINLFLYILQMLDSGRN